MIVDKHTSTMFRKKSKKWENFSRRNKQKVENGTTMFEQLQQQISPSSFLHTGFEKKAHSKKNVDHRKSPFVIVLSKYGEARLGEWLEKINR